MTAIPKELLEQSVNSNEDITQLEDVKGEVEEGKVKVANDVTLIDENQSCYENEV